MNKKKIALTMLLLLLALVSAFGISKAASNPKTHQKTIEALDEKKETVLKLTASAVAASTALAMVPGDATTPVANKLADFSSYFLVILIVIFLEKYLVTLVGYAAFTFLLPLASLIGVAAVWLDKSVLRVLACKLAIFGLVLFAVIPVSMKVSNIVEQTYEISAEATVKQADELTDEVNESVDTDTTVIGKVLDKIKGSVTGFATKGEELINHFIETIAIMLVTSCVIPILVLVFAAWLIRILFGVQINIPTKMPRLSKKREIKEV